MIVHGNKYHKINPALLQLITGKKGHGGPLPNPLAFWKINEGSGVVVNDSGPSGITLTSSGTIGGTAVINNWSAVPGQGMNAPFAVFAGPGTIPLASVGQAPASINFDGTKPFSASFWLLVNAASGGTENSVFGDLQGSPNFTGWEVYLDGGGQGLILALYNNFSSSNGIVVGMNQASIPLSQANHFVATYDGSKNASGVKWYMNGVQQSTTTYMNGLTLSAASTSPMLMGARIDNSSNLGQGTGAILKDVEIFGSVLTQTQVSLLFAQGN